MRNNITKSDKHIQNYITITLIKRTKIGNHSYETSPGNHDTNQTKQTKDRLNNKSHNLI